MVVIIGFMTFSFQIFAKMWRFRRLKCFSWNCQIGGAEVSLILLLKGSRKYFLMWTIRGLTQKLDIAVDDLNLLQLGELCKIQYYGVRLETGT